jgi:long-chain acyl-CoA synthetase
VRPGIAGVLDAALRERPDAEALLTRSGSLTYAELDEQADYAAAVMWGLGLRAGDRLAVCLPNDLDVVLAFHGAMRIGAVWVGIGEALAAVEKQHLVLDCFPSVVLAPQPVLDELEPIRKKVAYFPVSAGTEGSEWRRRMSAGGEPPTVDVDPSKPAGIAYTSGTTGAPKGVVHSQLNLLLPGEVLVASRGWGPDLRKGDCLPLTILNLMVLTTLLTAQAQGCCVVMDRRDAEGVAEWIERGRVTHWNGVPAQLHDLVTTKRVEPTRLASLREVWSGGGDCPETLRDRFEEIYGLSIRTTYGLTEAPTVVSIDPVGKQRKPGASGQVLPHLAVTAHAETSEICVAARRDGPWAGRWTPYIGTWGERGFEPNPDPVLATGDVGEVDADGWLTVRDRIKLVVVRGGANVYPAEVERVLLGCDGVAGAAVFGVPDQRMGQRVAALIEPAPGARVSVEDLRAACSKQLAAYKVPERWGVVESLPRNAMGKVMRPALAALLDVSGGKTRDA